jgi:hypothetical protein
MRCITGIDMFCPQGGGRVWLTMGLDKTMKPEAANHFKSRESIANIAL